VLRIVMARGSNPSLKFPRIPSVGQEKQTEQAIEKRQISENATAKAAPKFPAQTPAAALPQNPAPAYSKSRFKTKVHHQVYCRTSCSRCRFDRKGMGGACKVIVAPKPRMTLINKKMK
jgi:hypothetical protein